jgi:ceramide glucosyltransferase
MIAKLFMVLIFISWLYWLVALLLVFDFFRPDRPNHCDFMPPVSILKPVKGLDFQAYQNFASFCQQDYPEYEVLFGVADPDDPVIPIIERLKRDFPVHRIRLFITQPSGTNRKASLLQHLEEQTLYETLVVSDSDVRVTPNYLQRVVAPLADARVGLVTSPYLGAEALNLTAGLEALHMGVTFLPSIVVARKVIDMRFAMGASVTLRRRDLACIGGFAALADYLADDYQLGARIAGLGLKVRLSDYVMSCFLGATRFQDQWEREVRWMRCSHISRMLEYPGLLISFTTLLSLVLVLLLGFAPESRWILEMSLIMRWLVAWLISGRLGDHESRRWLIWLPLRDVLSALTWIVGGLGRRVAWRGEEFVLQLDGRMKPAPSQEKQSVWWLRFPH